MLWSFRSMSWLSAETERGFGKCSLAQSLVAVSPGPCRLSCSELDEVMYWTTFSQSYISVVMSGCANSTIETSVPRKKEHMTVLR